MNSTSQHCCLSLILAILIGALAFLLSSQGLLDASALPAIFFAAMVIGVILMIVIYRSMLRAEKTQLTRSAYCCCGNLSVMGSVGLILSALLSLALQTSRLPLLIHLGLGLVFFFLALSLLGLWCFLNALYRCSCHKEC